MGQSDGASRWRVCYQRATPSSFRHSANSVYKSPCQFVCLCVYHTSETTLSDGLENSGRREYL